MSNNQEDNSDEMKTLSEMYATMRKDAKTIMSDLEGAMKMWRDTSIVLAVVIAFPYALLSNYVINSFAVDNTGSWVILTGLIWVAALGVYYVAKGFSKYLQLHGRYSEMFEKSKTLE